MARPTIKTLAKLSGYSVGTVSSALQGASSVKRETREAILAIAEKAGYVANLDGVKLRTGKTFRVAVVVNTQTAAQHEWAGIEFSHILGGVAKALSGSRYEMAVHTAWDLASSTQEIRRIVEHNLADGIIFSGTLPQDPRILYLSEQGKPFVTYGMSDCGVTHPYVDIDSQAAAFDATTRLLDLGHRRIALINPPAALMYAQQRIQGYTEALAAHRLNLDPALVIEDETSARVGKQAMLSLMSLPEPPTALVCANEALTLGVLRGAEDLGLSVGAELTVISMDDIHISEYFVPAVSTYYVPIEKTSQLLGQYLLQRIEGLPVDALQSKFRATLIARQADRAPSAQFNKTL